MRAPMTKLAGALLIMAACGGDNSYSPTAPPIPAPPPPGSVTGNFFVNLGHDSGTRSLEVQLLADDVVLYSGPLFTGSPWDYHVHPLYLSGNLGILAAGRHALTLRVTRQEVSPERYRVSAYVEAGSQQVASWNESVTLATGDAWTGEFVLDDGSGT